MPIKRNIGLDLVRSTAICMVVLYHAPIWIPFGGLFEVCSVDLFFSLSGLLITQMVFERFELLNSARSLTRFLTNRWMRTMPLYYVFIVVNVFLVSAGPFIRRHYQMPPGGPAGGIDFLPNLAPFLFFLQNFADGGAERYHGWFAVSWSLAIEEWFYFGLAITLFVLPQKLKGDVRKWYWAGLALIIAVILMRVFIVVLWDRHGDPTYDDSFRRVLLLRADAFVYGGAIYICSRGLEGSTLLRFRGFIASAGLAIILVGWAMRHSAPEGALTKIFVPSLVPFGAALLLPFCAALRFDALPTLKSILIFLSTRTYSIYLAHIPLQYFFFCLIYPSPIGYAAFLAGLAMVANLLYFYVERPIMALRPMTAQSSASEAVNEVAAVPSGPSRALGLEPP
jgi:peptidoglycan/LPS O-acetylase OafA/YrhL